MARPQIKRALISVYDKTGIVDFARALVAEFGIEIISTGGTATLLKKEGIPVTLVEEVTGFPELLDGRVKTLHPKIHAGILADRDNPEHMRQLEQHGIKPIDMVVVNLYPFDETVKRPDCTFEQAIEMIDIGGPCLLRAAAKNHKHVLAVSRNGQFEFALSHLRHGNEKAQCDLLISFANEVFLDTANYDGRVGEWLSSLQNPEGTAIWQFMELFSWGPLRYGENPHQKAELLEFKGDHGADLTTADATDSSKVAMSFNNYLDASAAFELCRDITTSLNPSGTDPCGTDPSGTGFQPVSSCGTGFQPVSACDPDPCGTGLQPVDPNQAENTLKSIEFEKHSRRNLPHIQNPEKCYFLTFRVRQEPHLSPQERNIVFAACKFWAGKKLDLHAAVIMPNHVHLLITPLEIVKDQWASLSEIVHTIKRHSAREINKLRGAQGSLWLDEYFDRIMRNEKEFLETKDYIANNPPNGDLCAKPEEYAWWFDEDFHQLETDATSRNVTSVHRLETGATPDHRLQTGATSIGATSISATSTGAKLSVALFIKHTNPCGVGISADPIEAYRRAYLADPNAAMGGILAVSFPVDVPFAEAVMDSLQRWGKSAGAGAFFVEVWLAPEFDEKAVEVIRTRKPWGANVRLLTLDVHEPDDPTAKDFRRIPGGFLVQSKDMAALNEDQWKVATQRTPTESEMSDLRLAWLIAKHTKSNAISLVKDGMLIGNGAGQMSRVMSCRIATWLAQENGHADKLAGSVAASDAFFPFADGPKILLDAGVTALIQPGGSKRDAETIKLCDERGAAMIFTATRHFRH